MVDLDKIKRAAKAAELGWRGGSNVAVPMFALREALEALK